MQHVIFVDRMSPEDAPRVARIWDEHDRTGLPEEIGVARRTLYRFRGLYMHVVAARPDLTVDLAEQIHSARTHPSYIEVRDRLATYLTPYSSDCRGLLDTRAEEFYQWSASKE
ncbi:TcmI family type II polyketide cyclase [Streptomyces iranensis]|uniref:Polyketide synthesis cyclase n=1 Tax=Streptomyces iranensis TaxID=576784 RepID=A0A060ZSG8_9ACTN|nr:TcmI family type II polyketide cyclase [Streptomyces iranensis]MBP2060870.1 hypothetical protein [Streptomyces iranensis]CDR06331.1 Polyketide synthesis cyclase [Streptomyces iranensis]